MPFEQLPDGLGRIYVPEQQTNKKHPCRDCFSCQWCSDERCKICRPGKPCSCKKKNVEEKNKD